MNNNPKTQWNTNLYEQNCAFVWQYGEDILNLLQAQPGERILDLGCGTGHLTAKLAIDGAEVLGIDSSSEMIAKAQQNYPELAFQVADAAQFQVDRLFDAVFSNAVLHWVQDPDAAIRCIHQALKPNGRFVAEFGGHGNVQTIVRAVSDAFAAIDRPFVNPWYFPTIGDYASRLEHQGFDVTYAVLFDRLTPLQEGELGLAIWLSMFGESQLSKLTRDEQATVIRRVEESVRSTLYQNGQWQADYRRIRVVARKVVA